MSQRLTLPMNRCILLASYKNTQYYRQFGYHHYGVDILGEGSQEIFSCGDGVVFSAGNDVRFGNSVVLVYRNVEGNNGKFYDIACRMYHLSDIHVITGQQVKRGSPIGTAGNTGLPKSRGPRSIHLHIEFDTGIDLPHYAFGAKSGGNIIKKAAEDSSINPSEIWFTGEGQMIRGNRQGWHTRADLNIPKC